MDIEAHKLTTKKYDVVISLFDGQIISMINKQTKREYIYQKDDGWQKSTPLCFPLIGITKGGHIKLNGKKYVADKHGFIQKFNWDIVNNSNTNLKLKATNASYFLDRFPFNYDAFLEFDLNDVDGLTYSFIIVNRDKKEIPFKFGFHPAFNFTKGNVKFEQTESFYLVHSDGYVDNSEPPLEFEKINVNNIDFDTVDCYVIDSLNSKKITLDDITLTVNSPCLTVWKPTNTSKFVCIEPFYGSSSLISDEENMELKDHFEVQKVLVNKTNTYMMQIK